MVENFADFISCGALRRCAAYGSDHRAEFAGRNIFTEIRSCRFRDALLHQSAAEIVGSRFQTSQGLLKTKFDPRNLNVRDVAVQKHPGKRMNVQILVDRTSCTGATALEQFSLRMDESQRNELGKSACFLLNLAEEKQMPHPVFRELGMPVHHCGCRGNAETVRRANHLNPLPYFQLVGTQG